MSQVELYQSVLSKLGQLPAQELAALDAYLSSLIRVKPAARKSKIGNSNVSKVAGAWKDWDNQEFEDFLQLLKNSREEMFSDRSLQL
ncbi:MAG: hypothetical protein ACKVUS_12470 [Saprospiraceae bacterium]